MKTGYRVASAWINSKQAEEVAKYYTQGHTVKETAEFAIPTKGTDWRWTHEKENNR